MSYCCLRLEPRTGIEKNLLSLFKEKKYIFKPLLLEQLKQICKEYFDRMYMCESEKYDMEFEVRKRDFEVSDWEQLPFISAAPPPTPSQL